jgi:hypothetical protein
MMNYVVFQEKATNIAVSVSKNSLEFPDYEQLESQGYYFRVMEGRKNDCEERVRELEEELKDVTL